MDNPRLRAALFFPRRIVWLILTFLVMTAVIFTFMRAVPRDPATLMLGSGVSPEQAENLRRQLGLDQPIWKQYVRYLSGTLEGFTYAWGTDHLGRDIRSRARYALGLDLGSSLLIALIVQIPALLGGLLAGYLATRGTIWADLLDDLVMFPAEVMTSLPGLILLAFILATTGPGLKKLLVWLALAFILPRSVRMVRNLWVAASPERALWLRVVGTALGVLVLSTGLAVITQPVFGFLGLGVQPPQPDLGAMLSEGLKYMRTTPYAVLRPGRTLLFAAFGWFLLADTLLSRFGIYKREAWLELNR